MLWVSLRSISSLSLRPIQRAALCSLNPTASPDPSVAFWLETSLQRVFPASPAGTTTNLPLLAARNSRIAFQACLQNRRVHPFGVQCSLVGADDLKPQVRRVGYVPLLHHTTDTQPAELDGVGVLPWPGP